MLLAGQPRFAAGAEFEELPWAAYELSQLGDTWSGLGTYLGAEAFTLAGLRAKVDALPRVTDDYYREAVLLADVLALFPEEKP